MYFIKSHYQSVNSMPGTKKIRAEESFIRKKFEMIWTEKVGVKVKGKVIYIYNRLETYFIRASFVVVNVNMIIN